jgi:hypothetical protein
MTSDQVVRKFQAPSIKCQTNNKFQTTKAKRRKEPNPDECVWLFQYCSLAFVCDLVLAIWRFGRMDQLD